MYVNKSFGLKLSHSLVFSLVLTILISWSVQSVKADYWTVSGYDYEYNYDYSRSGRISREHRNAGDVDDWIERGNSTVTASPRFRDGIRLTAWASDYVSDDEYDFALASAIYLFDIPRRAQYIEIKVRYRGEGNEADVGNYEEIAGRVWIRNLKKERERRRYGDDNEETLYGDTFVLRAKRRSETIKIPAAYHVNENGVMELHVVAENGGLIDVEYIDVSSYRNQPDIRVVNRYIRSYDWRPWYNYTYSYFYEGPIYYATDYGYYYMWSYPVYDTRYVTIRTTYRRYLNRYRVRYPRYYYRSPHTSVNINVYDNRGYETQTRRLSKWTKEQQQVRREYDRSRLTKKRRSSREIERIRTNVRATIERHRSEPVLSDRVIQSRDARVKRRRSTQIVPQSSSPARQIPYGSRSSIMKGRSRSTPSQRTIRSTKPTERQKEIMNRIRSRTRPSSSSTKSNRTSSQQRKEVKKRRDSSSSISTNRTRAQSSSNKKNDDDEDDEQKKQERRENVKRRRR